MRCGASGVCQSARMRVKNGAVPRPEEKFRGFVVDNRQIDQITTTSFFAIIIIIIFWGGERREMHHAP